VITTITTPKHLIRDFSVLSALEARPQVCTRFHEMPTPGIAGYLVLEPDLT